MDVPVLLDSKTAILESKLTVSTVIAPSGQKYFVGCALWKWTPLEYNNGFNLVLAFVQLAVFFCFLSLPREFSHPEKLSQCQCHIKTNLLISAVLNSLYKYFQYLFPSGIFSQFCASKLLSRFDKRGWTINSEPHRPWFRVAMRTHVVQWKLQVEIDLRSEPVRTWSNLAVFGSSSITRRGYEKCY